MSRNDDLPGHSHRIITIALVILFAGAIQEVDGKTLKLVHTQAYTEKNYLVRCNGLCKDVSITARALCGMATLYAREDRPPRISGDSCSRKECTLCERDVGGGGHGDRFVPCRNVSTITGGRLESVGGKNLKRGNL